MRGNGPAIPFLVFHLLFSVAIAGCANPIASPSRPAPGIGSGFHPIVPKARGANFTDCQGSFVIFDVPLEWVEDDVPPNYTLRRYPGDITTLLLQLNTCMKASVDGADVGPTSFVQLALPVRTPPESGHSEEVDWFHYLVEMRVDNPAVGRWLQQVGVDAKNGTVTHRAPKTSFVMDVETDLREEGEQIYHVRAAVTTSTRAPTERERKFYGPDPSKDYWDQPISWEASGAYPGKVEMAESSRVAQVLGHQLPASTGVTVMSSVQRSIELPVPDLGGTVGP